MKVVAVEAAKFGYPTYKPLLVLGKAPPVFCVSPSLRQVTGQAAAIGCAKNPARQRLVLGLKTRSETGRGIGVMKDSLQEVT